MYDNEVKELCRKLKPVIGARADKIWLAYATSENHMEKQQMEAMIQAVAARNLSRKVDDIKILLPPPTLKDSLGEFPLGHVVYAGIPLFELSLSRENFRRHLAIMGITGSGKTTVCQNLIKHLIAANVPVLIVDWKRSYRNISSKIEVFSIGRKTANAISWNPLRPPPGVHPRSWISIIAEILEKSHLSGPGSGDILLEVLDEKFEELGFYSSTGEQPKIYPNFFDVKERLDKMVNRGRRGLWQDTAERIIRTLTFTASGAFNARHPIHLEDLLNRFIVFELDQELSRSLRTFFSEVILRWIHLHRLQEGESNELKSVLVLEEIHNLFPKNPFEKNATSGLETLARELRSFGQSLLALSQHPSLLPTWLLGNTNTLIFLALQHSDDVEAARKALFLERGDERYFSFLKVGEGIVRIQGRVNPCHVRFPLLEE